MKIEENMKTYNIPKNVKGIIFDIDGTLYTNEKYVFEQVDVQVRYYARLKNISVEVKNNFVLFLTKYGLYLKGLIFTTVCYYLIP